MTSGHETHPEDIQPIALGYDVWKADAWAESGMATKILSRYTEPCLLLGILSTHGSGKTQHNPANSTH